MSYKQQGNAIKEQIETTRNQRLQEKLKQERIGLETDMIVTQKMVVGKQIASVNLQTENKKLSIANIGLQTTMVQEGKAQDKLGFERADRMLGQQEIAAKLSLKSISVSALFEEVRHQGVMVGGGSSRVSIPGFGG